ncbi:hypothetical protein [Rosistilla oblonga]|uniref:hypothetical protein n=1 Tax=Rosistilla oblonga TaxID=2527990 RepID=UPI003A9812C4
MSRVTKAQLLRLNEAISRKQKLDSESRALESEIKQLRTVAMEDLRSTGKSSCKRSGFILRFGSVKARVSWKDEFIRTAGIEKANDLANNVGLVQTIEIVPAEIG